MAPAQTIMWTAMPRGLTVDPATLPVSVFVSPRLTGAPALGSFSDWLTWTEHLKTDGLHITFAVGGQQVTVPIDPAPLQPNLWNAIFDAETHVADYVFNNYDGRLVISYPVRATLALLKAAYQIGGISLALPQRFDLRQGRRAMLASLIDGFQVNWNEDQARSWRAELQHLQSAGGFLGSARLPQDQAQLGGDDLPDASQLPAPGSDEARNLRRTIAARFALFHHLPSAPKLVPPPMDMVLNFHKALSALHAYPALMRALGLVFDLDLPVDFLPEAPAAAPGAFGVASVAPGWNWAVEPTARPPAATAYIFLRAENGQRLFATAPRNPQQPRGSVMGLLNLGAGDFGLAQVDVDGALHKTIMLAETFGNVEPARHPEVFDPTTTLPALRSAGLALIADNRAASLLTIFRQSKAFNAALEAGQPQPQPFVAEDLVRGFRLDVWDSQSDSWHSLHRRHGEYTIKEQSFTTTDEEGFTNLAAVSPAPGADPAQANDLYLHEAIARWAGWSLSVALPGKHLTRAADPSKAVPPDDPTDPDFDPENPPATPFKMTTRFRVVRSSLPTLRFGRRYRMRARAVDLAGNSLALSEPLTKTLSGTFATPANPDGFAYLRYEPVAAPTIVLRDGRGVSGPGSSVDRIVIRTFNTAPALDAVAADLTAADRHIVPPRVAVELGERLGMFDDADGKLRTDTAIYQLIAARDDATKSQFRREVVIGQPEPLPVEPGDQLEVPYLPDVLARGAALRDLPGTPAGSTGSAAGTGSVVYEPLTDAHPRPGSATLISFGGETDWTTARPFRLALAEGSSPPAWDATTRVLTISLPKAALTVVPLSSYLYPDDLKLMGVWQWIREYIDSFVTSVALAEPQFPGSTADLLAHIIQRTREGGHWMLTPPHLLTLVHAVQQPIGRPVFVQIDVQHPGGGSVESQLESEAMTGPTNAIALDTITAWRVPGAIDAQLIGGLQVHGASTDKIDLLAHWDDPVDDPGPTGDVLPTRIAHATHADEIPLRNLAGGELPANADGTRPTGYYNPGHDLVCFVRAGDVLSSNLGGDQMMQDAAPAIISTTRATIASPIPPLRPRASATISPSMPHRRLTSPAQAIRCWLMCRPPPAPTHRASSTSFPPSAGSGKSPPTSNAAYALAAACGSIWIARGIRRATANSLAW